MTAAEYHKKYYRENLRKYKPGISVKQLAMVKMVSRQTIYNNVHLFDRIEHAKQLRFYINDKVLNWYPNETGPKIKEFKYF